MKADRTAILVLTILLGISVCGNPRIIKAEENQLEEGLDAIEDAIGQGKDFDDESDSGNISEGGTDMQERTSDDTIGTPDDFPAEYDFGSGKISDFSRTYMLKKMPEPDKNDTVLNTEADPDWLSEGNLPPTFYVYGTEDPFYEQFEEQYDVIRNMGIQTGRIALDGWPHGFGSDGGWVKQYADWLETVFEQE